MLRNPHCLAIKFYVHSPVGIFVCVLLCVVVSIDIIYYVVGFHFSAGSG